MLPSIISDVEWFQGWIGVLLQARRVASAGANLLRSCRRVVAPRLAYWPVVLAPRRYWMFAPVWVPPHWRSSHGPSDTSLFSYNAINFGGG